MNKTVIILRGVSGCGKSSFAELLNPDVICTADDFFMVDGEYKFNVSKLGTAHKVCQEKFEDALMEGKNKIVVANTNTSPKEFNFYKDMAEEYGYKVFVVVIENRHGNSDVHGVPEDTKEKQCQRILSSLSLI